MSVVRDFGKTGYAKKERLWLIDLVIQAACSRCCRRRLAMVRRLILSRSAKMIGAATLPADGDRAVRRLKNCGFIVRMRVKGPLINFESNRLRFADTLYR